MLKVSHLENTRKSTQKKSNGKSTSASKNSLADWRKLDEQSMKAFEKMQKNQKGKVTTDARKIQNNLTLQEQINKMKKDMKAEVIKKQSSTKSVSLRETIDAFDAFLRKYRTREAAAAALHTMKRYENTFIYKQVEEAIRNGRYNDVIWTIEYIKENGVNGPFGSAKGFSSIRNRNSNQLNINSNGNKSNSSSQGKSNAAPVKPSKPAQSKPTQGTGKSVKQGEFSVTNWDGYPNNGPKPEGPFRLLEGKEYEDARKAANKANQAIHKADPSLKGKQIHEIHPVKFGGSPTDKANKIPLTPKEHAQYTKYWNNLMRKIQKKP